MKKNFFKVLLFSISASFLSSNTTIAQMNDALVDAAVNNLARK